MSGCIIHARMLEPGAFRTGCETPSICWLLLLRSDLLICRADRGAVLHAAVGKVDFPVEHLHANLGALTAAILAARPKGIKGGG